MKTTKKLPPLTDQQRQWVQEVHPKFIEAAINKTVPIRAKIMFGRDIWQQEVWIVLCRAAQTFDPERYPGIELCQYAWKFMLYRLQQLVKRYYQSQCIWNPLPTLEHSGETCEPIDHRTDRQALLSIWYDDDFINMRRSLTMRERLYLYLYYVEGWDGMEIALVVRISKSRVHQILDRARERLQRQATRSYQET